MPAVAILSRRITHQPSIPSLKRRFNFGSAKRPPPPVSPALRHMAICTASTCLARSTKVAEQYGPEERRDLETLDEMRAMLERERLDSFHQVLKADDSERPDLINLGERVSIKIDDIQQRRMKNIGRQMLRLTNGGTAVPGKEHPSRIERIKQLTKRSTKLLEIRRQLWGTSCRRRTPHSLSYH